MADLKHTAGYVPPLKAEDMRPRPKVDRRAVQEEKEDMNHCFGETCRLHHQGRAASETAGDSTYQCTNHPVNYNGQCLKLYLYFPHDSYGTVHNQARQLNIRPLSCFK